MRAEIKIPSAGESVSEIRISRWIKSNGESVKADEPILELETDKANMELEAETAGTLEILTSEGTTVQPGTVVGYIDTEGVGNGSRRVTQGEDRQRQKGNQAAQGAPSPQNRLAASKPETSQQASREGPAGPENLSPAIRKFAREHNVSPEEISGTGKKGRFRKEDILRSVKKEAHEQPDYSRLPTASPEKTSVELSEIVAQQPSEVPEDKPRERIVPMSLLRRKIAERMMQAQQTAAILTTFNEVDMSEIQNLRGRYKESFKKKYGVDLGLMSFFIKATIESLKQIPELNASIEGETIVYKNYYNIGVAVSTDRGLVVPVLRDADRMTFFDMERALSEYAAKARAGKITVDDLRGSTFTITNGGVFGSLLSTPILNPPESGILGMHGIKKRPIVVNDAVMVRPMMYLALSYDHRIVDGKEAVTFLVRIKEALEDPHRILLGV